MATIRALKYNGGVPKAELTAENLDALRKGIVNLKTHIENMKKFGVPVVVAINHFYTDTDAEVAYIKDFCNEMNTPVAFSDVFLKGGEGGIELAKTVVDVVENNKSNFSFLSRKSLLLSPGKSTVLTA